LAIADLTGDGWVDSADVAEYLAHGMPNDGPSVRYDSPQGAVQQMTGATR
jgi:hypothetical protein